jgi:hypothetical protein
MLSKKEGKIAALPKLALSEINFDPAAVFKLL